MGTPSSYLSLAEPYSQVVDSCCTVLLNGGSGTCSGCFVKNSSNIPGILFTCSHCIVEDLKSTKLNTVQVAVKNVNGVKGIHKLMPGKVLGYCIQADLAVIQVLGITDSHPAQSFANPTNIKTGDAVFVVGNPGGRDDSSCSPGWIRDRAYEAVAFEVTSVYINAPTTFGNSGSPVFAMDGSIVSVLSFGPADQNGSAAETEGGGSRSEFIKTIVDAFASSLVIKNPRIDTLKRYQVPYIGISGLTTDAENAASAGITDLDGYIITKIEPDSPFSSIFDPPGDETTGPIILLSADGKPFGINEGQYKFADVFFFATVNQSIPFTWKYAKESSVRSSVVTIKKLIGVEKDTFQLLKNNDIVFTPLPVGPTFKITHGNTEKPRSMTKIVKNGGK